jgi:2-polyprenyl-3-methyl-5-hydroxy-6-metoxy-1,4-benzoquinol methylase
MTGDSTSAPSVPAGARFHEALAPSWNDGYEARSSFRRRARFVEQMLGGRVAAGSHWLDVGCGSGVFARALAAAGAAVTGVDAAPAMLEAAQKSRAIPAPAITYQLVRTVETLPFSQASFDGVICLSVLEYLEDPLSALYELHRVLRPDGMALTSVPNRWSFVRGVQRSARAIAGALGGNAFPYLGVSRFAFTRSSLVAMLNTAGFAVETVEGFRGLSPRALGDWTPADLLFALGRPAPASLPTGHAAS